MARKPKKPGTSLVLDASPQSDEPRAKQQQGPGRPRKEVSGEVVRALAAFGATLKDVAGYLEVSHDVIERHYADDMNAGRFESYISLRRRQFEMAMDGNPTMLIWLGKVMLGQRETSEVYTHVDVQAVGSAEKTLGVLQAITDVNAAAQLYSALMSMGAPPETVN